MQLFCLREAKLLQKQLKCVSFIRSKSSSQRVVAIRREDNVVWERRAPLAPSHVRVLVHKGIKVLVQPANKRAFSIQILLCPIPALLTKKFSPELAKQVPERGAIQTLGIKVNIYKEYVSAGATVEEDLSAASVILGVKQVPSERLLPDKTYIFFSHTIKAQRENMAMLDAILDKNIRLIDYEKMEEDSGMRVVAFGKYAGLAGMINILHGMGLRLLALGHHTPFMHIGISHNYRTSGQAIQAVRDAGYEISLGRLPESIGPLTFAFTGTGNVSMGAQEIFRELPHVYVEPHELKNVAEHGDASQIYGCVVDMHNHLRRKTDGGFDMQEYFDHPDLYESVFAKEIAPYASCIVNGIFWRPNDPRLLTTSDAAFLQDFSLSPKMSPLFRRSSLDSVGCPRLPHRLIAIGDVSADPGGSIQFMQDCTSIDAPFEVYDASSDSSVKGVKGPGILMCSIDNLPAQLPRESTQFFGDQLLPYMDDIVENNAVAPFGEIDDRKVRPVVKNAIIASNGKLTPKYEYIEKMRRKRVSESEKERRDSFKTREEVAGQARLDEVLARRERREKEGAMYATSSRNHKVLVLGAGYVSAPVVDYLTSYADTAVTVASSLPAELDRLSSRYKHANPVHLDIVKQEEHLDDLVKGHDLVVSLLPYTLHPAVAGICIKHKKNLVTASYNTPEMLEFHSRATDAGISIVMEVGVDPGIDHMLAMECFDDIRQRDGEISSFVSWCGGLPAPEVSDNPLKYKFSWSPRGVLMVTLAASRYLMNGEIVERGEGGDNYRNGVLPIDFMPGFNLEGLPNRDSLKYKQEYGLHDANTVLRGTLRYKGFADAMVGILNLGLVTLTPHPLLDENSPSLTWRDFLSNLLAPNGRRRPISHQDLESKVYEAVEQNEQRLRVIKDLGLLSDRPVHKAGNPLDALAHHLALQMPYGEGERDMLVLRHEVEGRLKDQSIERHAIDLVVYGDTSGDTAMAKSVGYPCAIAARMVLLGKVENKGIVTPLGKTIYEPLLQELRRLGIQSKSTVQTVQ